MMMNIFSSFDPFWFNMCYKNSILMISIPVIIMNMFWLNLNKLIILPLDLFSFTVSQFMKTKLKLTKSLSMIITSLFIFIVYINILGLVPYLFSVTSHIIFTLSLSLPLWSMLIMSSITNNSKKTIGHLLPDSAPMWLNPFLVMIESISIMLRPMTLSFRLAANMTAGHVVLALISSFSLLSMKVFMSAASLSVLYIMFELGICMIQAYIFCMLISLYANDHS